MTVRLILADDHPIILNCLADIFRKEEDFQVLACCRDGAEALQVLRQDVPDVAILDCRMPGLSGLELARAVRAEQLPTRIVLFSGELDDDEMTEVMRLEIDGLVLKEQSPQLLIQCVRRVHAGERRIEQRMTVKALETLLHKERTLREAAAVLSPREIELVRMVAVGLRNREIGEQLFISEVTVKTHLYNIYKKLNLKRGRLALLRYAQEKGLA